jgi:alpha-L-fucosidase 2
MFALPSLLLITLASSPLLGMDPVHAATPNALVYEQPAEDWMTEALPIGNGYMGVMFFGGVDEERLQCSEGTLWAGGPGAHPDYQFGNRPGAAASLGKVRALIRDGELNAAHALASNALTGVIHGGKQHGLDFGDFGAQQPLGDLFVSVANEAAVTAYSRGVDLARGVGTVAYQSGGTRHERSFFGSYPRRAMVYRFANDHPEGTQYSVRLTTPHPLDSLQFEGDTLRLRGHLIDNGLPFETLVLFRTDGTLSADAAGQVTVTGARTLSLYQVAGSAYRNAYPEYRGNDFEAANQQALAALRSMEDEAIYREHLADYQALFGRVDLQLGKPAQSPTPTDARLKAYAAGSADPALEALLFQYARYLTIMASRPGTMPMHLQGKWNHQTNPPWACDYHTNINLQMLYWPAESTQLAECHEPLMAYIAQLVAPGRVSAKEHFGTRGWVVSAMNNAYGFTAPGWDFPWGFFPAGAGWLCQHLWEHYDYTRDLDYLRETAYPVMAEAALFWMDYLQPMPDGRLVSIPSYSPEHGGISGGASMDHQIAWDLLSNCLKAAAALGIEDDFTRSAQAVRDRIAPPLVGSWGTIAGMAGGSRRTEEPAPARLPPFCAPPRQPD